LDYIRKLLYIWSSPDRDNTKTEKYSKSR